MATSNTQKLERLHKLTITFKDVSDAVTDIVDNDPKDIRDHINKVKSALISSGHNDTKALGAARGMVFALRKNGEFYRQTYLQKTPT